VGFFLFWLVQIFLLSTEYFFFEEFKSRFNTVAVDYLFYPHEVFVNIWDSYPVAKVLIACAVASAAWVFVAGRLFREIWDKTVSARLRIGMLGGLAVVCGLLSLTISLKGNRFSKGTHRQ